ncbi:hypothetical protein AWC38_SpisGene7061 [Stylophora pistillata]|uniref:Uncharacterized protein n=1 Tax=Stylophora pistillata TaxID=50429 RepID=A0A2B4SIC2_STYPI|nr:hypothetical protein AWC38_SpisGene7061 [Stylophora pistillata]
MEYKATKIKGAVRLHSNEDRALGMVREFEEQAARMRRRSIFKEAAQCAEELGLELDLEHAQGIKKEVQRCQIEKLGDEIRNQRWKGRLVTTRLEDESLSADGWFWWLTEWKNCPSHTTAGLVELYEKLLLTRVYTSQKTHTSGEGEADQQEVRCNRVDARIVNHMCKRVVTLEMSCPWVNNRTRKDEEKTPKYGPLRWELRKMFPGYEVKQYNILMVPSGRGHGSWMS